VKERWKGSRRMMDGVEKGEGKGEGKRIKGKSKGIGKKRKGRMEGRRMDLYCVII
jgi:hypothetical protein